MAPRTSRQGWRASCALDSFPQRIPGHGPGTLAPAAGAFLLPSGEASVFGRKTQCVAVGGGRWGDAGKGTMVDVLAEPAGHGRRYRGGARAGQTVRREKRPALDAHKRRWA